MKYFVCVCVFWVNNSFVPKNGIVKLLFVMSTMKHTWALKKACGVRMLNGTCHHGLLMEIKTFLYFTMIFIYHK